jgi:hypothetical protein
MQRKWRGKRNTNTMCASCKLKRNVYAQGYYVPVIPVGAQFAAVGMVEAAAQGHHVPYMDQDTEPDCWIGQCLACELFLVVDLEESSYPYGLVAQVECSGQRRVEPAIRRDPFMMDHSSTPLTNEPLEGIQVGVIEPQWDDPEGNFGQRAPKGDK